MTGEIENCKYRHGKVGLVVLLILAVSSFVPVVHLPYSDHTECANFGANCRHVSQYGSLSHFYLCSGAIYQTDGSYWFGTCMYG
jgi:hypothetical protein